MIARGDHAGSLTFLAKVCFWRIFMAYRLKTDSAGRHYEEFCDLNDPVECWNTLLRAKSGNFGGHTSNPNERYQGRVYPLEKTQKVIIKLLADS